jgi:F0F1-type ATP synthase delta subunit
MNQSASRRDIVRAITPLLVAEPGQRHTWLQRLAAYMVKYNMTNQAGLLVNDIAHELHRTTGLLTVEVVSARELNDGLRQSLRELLQNQTGAATKTVVLHETTDQDLLGGFVARTPDAEIDASVQTKLKKLSSLA